MKMVCKLHICVCICTFKRTDYLPKLLKKLENQATDGLFDYSIVIVDNDYRESARQVIELYSQKSKLRIKYFVEPEQNIAMARNKAVHNSKGDYIGFIDDDEFPPENWLLNLYLAMNKYQADGILAPVLPYYEKEPPKWVLKGNFFDRPTHETGQILNWENTRTGNALLKRNLFFSEDCQGFNTKHCSGGEDKEFFRKEIMKGRVFMWCNEAPVFEYVPSHRWKRTFMIKRALLRGKVVFERSPKKYSGIAKSFFAITTYTFLLPFFLIFGQHIFMRYLIKNFDHIGKVLAAIGFNVIKEKYVVK